MTQLAERVRPADVSKMTSLSVRKIQELSADGKIPSAAKLGGVWTYDPTEIRKWIKQSERAAWSTKSEARASTSAARYGGDAAKLPAESIAARYEQLIGAKRRDATSLGGRSSSARK